MSEPYDTDADVIGSKGKYHKPKCPCVNNIPEINRKTFAELAACRGNRIDPVRSL